jgi:lysophospholipase L1-like esterase
LLTQHLNDSKIPLELIANPSVTGWTTQDLIDKELPIYDESNPDFATLLIGVNDWVQKVTEEQFQKNLTIILDRMQAKLKIKTNLILISIPDFGVTPKGAQYSGGRDIAAGIAEFNSILHKEAIKRKLSWVDIYPTTQLMKNNPNMISSDELHPSAAEYELWERLIFPVALTVLKK